MKAEPVASRLYTQTVVEHERRLPAPGQVLVGAGDQVQSDDVIARASEQGPLRIVDAAEALGVARERLPRYLRVQVGQVIEAGQALAAGGFMGWRTVRAPVSGRVAALTAGRILIEETPHIRRAAGQPAGAGDPRVAGGRRRDSHRGLARRRHLGRGRRGLRTAALAQRGAGRHSAVD